MGISLSTITHKHTMMPTYNKSLLRKIKHECLIDYSPKIEVDNTEYLKYLDENYKVSNVKPYSQWTLNELYTRQEELLYLAHKVSILFPIFYREEYWLYSGECYDIFDELENRAYGFGNSIYDDY